MDLKYNDYYDLVEENGINLKDVPNEFKTLNLCLMAIKANGLALEYISEGKEKEVIINYLNFLNEYEKYKEQLVEDEIDLGSIPKQFRKKEFEELY